MVNFESSETEQEREIVLISNKITAHFRIAEALLKSFGKLVDEKDVSPIDKKVGRNMRNSMLKKIQDLTGTFRTTQKMYGYELDKRKAGNQVDWFDDTIKTGAVVEIDFTQAQKQESENLDWMVNQRDAEINTIVKNVEELAQIFKELAVLVIDQGTILDRIDFNMEQAVSNVEEGNKKLEEAEKEQKSGLAFKSIIVLAVLIMILVIALIARNASRTNTTTTSSSGSGSGSGK
jgi:syntaxin 16